MQSGENRREGIIGCSRLDFSNPAPGLPRLALGLLVGLGFIATAQAQLGTGWTPTSYTKRIHLDDDVDLQTFTWTAYKSVCSPTACADYTYDSGDDSETFRIFDSRSNRSEIRLQNDYSSGMWQFEGYVTIYPPLQDESLFQIFGNTGSAATFLMMRGYSNNNGSIRVMGGSHTIATGVYNQEVRINIIHQHNVSAKFYVNGVFMHEKAHNDPGVVNYWKYGCYGTTAGNVPAIVKWRRVRTFRDGVPPGTELTATPNRVTVAQGSSVTTMINVAAFGGNTTLSVSNVPPGATASFNPTTVTGGNGTSTLTITTTGSITTGAYPLTITAVGGGTNRTATVTLGVVPQPWKGSDVGSPGVNGGASFSNGVFTVNGGGSDIWGSADKFHFAHQSFPGDFTLTARVTSQQNTDPWAKAGVMIRETTNTDSKYIGNYVTPTASHGVSLQYRSATASNAVNVAQISGPVVPYWVRLVRAGNNFTGYHSADGTNWTQTGAASIAMSNTVLLGLAVTAHDDATTGAATFSNVSLPGNFSLATTPASRTIAVGHSNSFQVALTSLNGFSGGVNLGVSGLPAGVSANFNPASVSGNGVVTLNLSVSNSATVGSYPLVFTGTNGSLVRTSAATLVITANLIWNSISSPAWDTTTVNWFNEATSANSVFAQGNDVLFADGTGLVTNVTIASGLAMSPATMTVDAATNRYSISGAGKISGAANLVKTGAGLLLLNTTNDFTGTVTIADGVLRVGTNTALGSTAGGTLVTNTGALDVNGLNFTGETITASGTGAGGQGAVINSGATQTTALRNVTLAGDVTFGGSSRWDIRAASLSSTNGCSLSTSGQPFKITKVGTNQVSLVAVGVDPALGDIDVLEGAFAIQVATSQVGNPAATITVFSNATLNVYRLTNTPLNKVVVLKGGATFYSENDRNVILGPVQLDGGGATFNVASAGTAPALVVSNTVSGDGGLIKTGAAPLILGAMNSYSGNTTVNAGSLALAGAATISESARITVASGAWLDVGGRADQRLTLAADQMLAGNGAILGHLTVGDGATISPGSSIGSLTVTGAVTLLGTCFMELNKTGATNDLVTAASIAYGGTLALTNLAGTLTVNDSFKLFHAPAYSGAFADVTPGSPAPGLKWDTNSLTTSGTLKLAVVPPTTPPVIGGISLVGTNVVFTGSNGVAGGMFYVLASSNLAQPLLNWSLIQTSYFDGAGGFAVTNEFDPTHSGQFFRLQVVP